MSYKLIDPCIAKAYDDEMLFVLMARDPFAPHAIMEWAKQSINSQPEKKIIEAVNCANEMVRNQWRISQLKANKDQKNCPSITTFATTAASVLQWAFDASDVIQRLSFTELIRMYNADQNNIIKIEI